LYLWSEGWTLLTTDPITGHDPAALHFTACSAHIPRCCPTKILGISCIPLSDVHVHPVLPPSLILFLQSKETICGLDLKVTRNN